MNRSYPIIPGRGLTSEHSTALRREYLQEQGIVLHNITDTSLSPGQIRNNIESYIGTTEIPLGLVGPLLFNSESGPEMVHALVGTLEGALVASMNRGAKAVSLSRGITAHVLHQKMIRTPMFIFRTLADSIAFSAWVERNVQEIRIVAERHSNHATLTSVLPQIVGRSVHVQFVYTTGDATGQNMSTTCTWHATLWMKEAFEAETSIEIVRYVIEGNGASDKKVSGFSMSHGRGIHVVAECHLDEEVINSVLRTTSADMMECYSQSLAASQLSGMIGYNINVANAIAAIFVATGQDLGSLHESSLGVLTVEKTERGLYLALNLPTLVIGTVGGGTHLPRQREALEVLDCYGTGKITRFASLIAGFALALEVSTFAAIVGGQFAAAHERLGRNKPIRWLLSSEIDRPFVAAALNGSFADRTICSVELQRNGILDNGILMNLAGRVSRKLIGFVPINVTHRSADAPDSEQTTTPLLMKIKPLDREVVEGLHLMATAVNTTLASLLYDHRDALEYRDCHTREIALYELLHQHQIQCIPRYYGRHIEQDREIYLFIQELLDHSELTHFNSENRPEEWDSSSIREVIRSITDVHRKLSSSSLHGRYPCITSFRPWEAAPLYRTMIDLAAEYHHHVISPDSWNTLRGFVDALQSAHCQLQIPDTIIHNDFNPRNIALRQDGTPCIYDWELSVIGIPHRDIIEFLSFTLEEGFSIEEFNAFLAFHYSLYEDTLQRPASEAWQHGYQYAIMEYLVTRVSFYLVGDIVTRYGFSERILKNALRMFDIVSEGL